MPARLPGSSVLVELVGPPGAGKTTLLRTLLAREPRAQPMPNLRRRRGEAVRLLLRIVQVIGVLVVRRAPRNVWTRDDLVMMAYLLALPGALRRDPAPPAVVVFDQGPIYTLSRGWLRHPRMRRWAAARFDEWRSLLDLVVLLDAPDEVLATRIRTREKEHRVKEASPDEMHREVATDREIYAVAVERMAADGTGPAVLGLDTTRTSPETLFGEVVAQLDALRANDAG